MIKKKPVKKENKPMSHTHTSAPMGVSQPHTCEPILGEVPTEFFEAHGSGPSAFGKCQHVGWCWWAMGSMGDAPSYEAARDAAVAEIQRLMDRVEVLP